MDNKCCPSCGEQEELVDSVSVLLTFEEWDGALAFMGLVIIFGVFIGLADSESLAFAVLVTLPFLFKFVFKKNCLHCNIQFSPEEEQV